MTGHKAVSADTEPGQAATTPFRRKFIAAYAGTVVEYYEITVYSYLTIVLAGLFFPSQDPTASLFAALGAFAATFLVRPIGGLLLGWFGDRKSRRGALFLALAGMTVATFAIGALPTYAAVGVAATVLLVAARIVQGLSAGGELAGAATYILENSPARRRGFYVGTLYTASLAGTIVASSLTFLLNVVLTPEQIHDWGWRIPFLLALPLGAVGIYIRRRLEDPQEFVAALDALKAPRPPILTVVRAYWRQVLIGFGIGSMIFVTYYLAFSYSQIHLITFIGMSGAMAALVPTVGLVFSIVLVPFVAHAGDRIGRRVTLLIGIAVAIVCAVPGFLLLDTGNLSLAILGGIVLALPCSIFIAVGLVAICEMFPTAVRFTGVALCMNTAVVAFGPTNLYATALVQASGAPLAPAGLIVAMALTALPLVLWMKSRTNAQPHSQESTAASV